ncbi:hypothetical protein MHYMCMPSP_00655 [Hyalomma marginatum]|uniref:Uncharacterized protein n=1 Tax=Hyalomma marginatum TaxID=34627 RepID=A0A8S4BUH7_9ACAR|nr:hypothetical protein MHYMCMPASI_00445 [Hyalomma marginatum]CAG7592400.1 hypothetical protein MHYMCMPSP_00655 [Hyalomma marginatum]
MRFIKTESGLVQRTSETLVVNITAQATGLEADTIKK